MSEIDDGGPAFPGMQRVSLGGDSWDWDHASGMPLRDYMAIHADQPGAAEIVTEAGLVMNSQGVWKSSSERIARHFNEWWEDVPQAERFRLSAAVRYRIADAMIAARKETSR